MAKFEKGDNRPRKQKGDVSIITKEARVIFKETLEGQVSNIELAFNDVFKYDKAKYLELFAKYAQYFVPKQVDITTKGEEVKQVFKIGNTEIEL